MPLQNRSWTKRCYDFVSHAPGISNKIDLISQEYTHWVFIQAVMEQKSCVNKRGMSAGLQSAQEASLYCCGTAFFWADIQTAPPSWDFRSPYQQPTTPALGNVWWIMWAIARKPFLDAFVFQETNLHITIPALASDNPRPSLLPSRFTNTGCGFASKRKPGTLWPVPGTELWDVN